MHLGLFVANFMKEFSEVRKV